MSISVTLAEFGQRHRLWIGLLCFLAYLPVINNGFIADDFVKLNAVEILKLQPSYIFATPPEVFRTTSDIVFIFLKQCFGYRAGFFYVFSIALHFLNCLLLRRLLIELPTLHSSATIAAICFAVFQAPQEAVMWLAAISEQLVTTFVLATLILWVRRQYGWSLACYSVALVSKESAVMAIALIPIVSHLKGQPAAVRKYLLFLIPTLGFAVAFLSTWSQNYLIAKDYAMGVQAISVALRTLWRLMWPWFPALLVLLRLDNKRWISLRWLMVVLLLLGIAVGPYVFMVYQPQLPSRSVYLASAVLMSAIAVLIQQLQRSSLRRVYLVAFVGFNILYLWFRKDGQYENRAAPTTQLIAAMRQRSPGPLYIRGFAYDRSPEVGYYATAMVPGWQVEMIAMEGWNPKSSDCTVLRWDAATARYIEDK